MNIELTPRTAAAVVDYAELTAMSPEEFLTEKTCFWETRFSTYIA